MVEGKVLCQEVIYSMLLESNNWSYIRFSREPWTVNKWLPC